MEKAEPNRKAPVPQDSASLLRLVKDARTALDKLHAVAEDMGEEPGVTSVDVANFWIFHDGINAISKFADSARIAVREAKLLKGAYNAEGTPIPQRSSEKKAEQPAKKGKK